MRSPSIGNNANVNLHIGINAGIGDTFSFYHKTSTDAGDRLILTLNNNELDSWSGISDWERSEFELREGNNLIRFSFKKDSEGSAGEDAVMIDELHFPPFAKLVLFAGDDAEVCSNATFTPEGYIYNHKNFAWSTNGDGTFDDATLEHPTYTFGETDKAEGQVELTLTGTCAINDSQRSSTVTVSVIPSFGPNDIPQTPSGANEVDLRLVSQSEYMGEEIENVIYTWNLEPETAGSITVNGHHALVEWDSDYRGQASISDHYENPCGSTSASETLDVNLFNSTGLSELDLPVFEVYPNPTVNGKINLIVGETLQGEALVEVYNLLGERMMIKTISQLRKGESLCLDLRHLVAGLYIIKLSAEKGTCSRKISLH